MDDRERIAKIEIKSRLTRHLIERDDGRSGPQPVITALLIQIGYRWKTILKSNQYVEKVARRVLRFLNRQSYKYAGR